jgi:hypothetical protein
LTKGLKNAILYIGNQNKMSELLLERPPEAMVTAEAPLVYGIVEKEVAGIAIKGSGLVEMPTVTTNQDKFGEQLSIENEPSVKLSWPVTPSEKGIVPSVIPENRYVHLPDMSSLEEHRYTAQYIERSKAHEEVTSGKIDWPEFNKRVADKTPRTYQYPLLRQDGQAFKQETPVVNDDPNKGVGTPDGTFWHGSNQVMEPGDRVLPSGEVPDTVHQANKSKRQFHSSSSPMALGTQYDGRRGGGEKDFAFGHPRDVSYLPTAYGEHIYKVSSPNNEVVATINGPEVWAEGGATVEKRMHPDFARNYREAAHRVNKNPFQPGLPGMESGLQFVPEADLDVSSKEFYEKYPNDMNQNISRATPNSAAGPEDVALPGIEEYGKRQAVPVATPSDSKIPPM